MPKRTIEEIIANVKEVKSEYHVNTQQAMTACLNNQEWDDLLILIERLNFFYKAYTDAKSR